MNSKKNSVATKKPVKVRQHMRCKRADLPRGEASIEHLMKAVERLTHHAKLGRIDPFLLGDVQAKMTTRLERAMRDSLAHTSPYKLR